VFTWDNCLSISATTGLTYFASTLKLSSLLTSRWNTAQIILRDDRQIIIFLQTGEIFPHKIKLKTKAVVWLVTCFKTGFRNNVINNRPLVRLFPSFWESNTVHHTLRKQVIQNFAHVFKLSQSSSCSWTKNSFFYSYKKHEVSFESWSWMQFKTHVVSLMQYHVTITSSFWSLLWRL